MNVYAVRHDTQTTATTIVQCSSDQLECNTAECKHALCSSKHWQERICSEHTVVVVGACISLYVQYSLQLLPTLAHLHTSSFCNASVQRATQRLALAATALLRACCTHQQ
jgi:hypothetical protein